MSLLRKVCAQVVAVPGQVHGLPPLNVFLRRGSLFNHFITVNALANCRGKCPTKSGWILLKDTSPPLTFLVQTYCFPSGQLRARHPLPQLQCKVREVYYQKVCGLRRRGSKKPLRQSSSCHAWCSKERPDDWKLPYRSRILFQRFCWVLNYTDSTSLKHHTC